MYSIPYSYISTTLYTVDTLCAVTTRAPVARTVATLLEGALPRTLSQRDRAARNATQPVVTRAHCQVA